MAPHVRLSAVRVRAPLTASVLPWPAPAARSRPGREKTARS